MSYYACTRKRDYYRCPHCDSIQLDQSQLLSVSKEKMRYDTHNNDVFDKGYQNFVSPITNYILKNSKMKDVGLDFGAGPGPVISKILSDHGYQIFQYDPHYYPNIQLLNNQYDYIVACEVIEHFNQPKKEFTLLKTLLKSQGYWIFMTDLYDDSIEFNTWYYKNDETHVIFYTKKTLEFLKETYHFNQLAIDKRLIIFS
ncbi:class I SAM-dependent methyltransferase [Mycoplasmatota bacterium]|nr:class I SAM-dependent methyltransferase [Mycoplasmatota bacterium]